MASLVRILVVCCSFSLIASSFAQNQFENGHTYKICTAVDKNECLSSFEPGQNTVSLGKVITDVYKNDARQQWEAERGFGTEGLTILTPKKNGYNSITYNLPEGSSFPTFNFWRIVHIPTQDSLYLIQLFRWPSRETLDDKNILGCLQYKGHSNRVQIGPCEPTNEIIRWRFERVED